MNKIENNTYKRVTKKTAIKAFLQGKNLYILPCKARLDSIWFSPYLITKNDDCKTVEDLEKLFNSFIYYNCNNELGKYISYYIEK